ncbi:hypothetical protein ACFL1K_05975 [Candidatus Omnitrophota bacterium]
MKTNKRSKKYLGTSFQKRLLILVFVSSAVPALIVAMCMYYMIFNLFARQLFIPEVIAFHLMPVLKQVTAVIIIVLPAALFLIWIYALNLSHRISGPVLRLERELHERITGIKSGPIELREEDELKSVSIKLNRLLRKWKIR